MFNILLEKITPDLYVEIEPLLYASWDSTKSSMGNGRLKLDMESRYQEQALDNYIVSVAWDEFGNPIAVCSFWIRQDKLTNKFYAQNDLIYVKPEFRVEGNARKIWDFCIAELKSKGIFEVRMSVPISSPQSFFKALGMVPRAITYSRIYDEESDNPC